MPATTFASRNVNNLLVKMALFFLFLIFLIHHWIILYIQPLLPGFDGGYYAVQVRDLLRSGTLYYSAPPIAFLIFALFAKIFLLLNLFPPPLCVINGVKFGLALMKALCIFPTYLIFKQLTKRDAIAVGGAILFELHPFFMLLANATSLFKNAVGVFFLLFYIYYLNKSTLSNDWRDMIPALVFISLTAMTHILDFGLALAYTVSLALIEAIRNKGLSLQSSLSKLIVIELVSLASLFTIILIFAPVFFGTYYKFISFIQELLSVESSEYSITIPPTLEPFVTLSALIAIISILLCTRFGIIDLSKRIALALDLITIFLLLPLYSQQWYLRFILVTFIPAILTLPELFNQLRDLKKIIALIVIFMIIFTPAYMQSARAIPVINPIEFRDINNMAPLIERGDTIVVTRFGLHYWVTWFLDIKTEYHINKLDDYIQSYHHVYLIVNKKIVSKPGWVILYIGKELMLIKVK